MILLFKTSYSLYEAEFFRKTDINICRNTNILQIFRSYHLSYMMMELELTPISARVIIINWFI